MSEGQKETCSHPECESTEIVIRLGGGQEPYCMTHIDYGMGRVFGPLHGTLDAAKKAGIGDDPDE